MFCLQLIFFSKLLFSSKHMVQYNTNKVLNSWEPDQIYIFSGLILVQTAKTQKKTGAWSEFKLFSMTLTEKLSE